MTPGRVPRLAALLVLAACAPGGDREAEGEAEAPLGRPEDVPALHHVMLNSEDPDEAIEWYLAVWPTAERTEIAGMPAVAAEMHLLFNEVDRRAPGGFDTELGRPVEQSPLWHIGAFANTTDMDGSLGALGIEHLPLYISPEDEQGVWRSGLVPYAGMRTAVQIEAAEHPDPRPGGFSYVLAPDDVLFELTGGPDTRPSMSHVHIFHEQPRCAVNWYLEHLGMSRPGPRTTDGPSTTREPIDACAAEIGEGGWPSLERVGTIREPRGTVIHGNGSLSFYPRQCHDGRCGQDRPLVPSRGQVVDHMGFTVDDVEAWHAWLTARGVDVLEAPHRFHDSRAFMVEGPDGLAIELVGAVASHPSGRRPLPDSGGPPGRRSVRFQHC